ncbi:long-chain-fatty-acid--CoA ligase [Primorskyibacter aestuariivivens]|uniref:long-chain-fatty-acid--CoA ligase n=1 Tax=Primorskyibacter aestuariivivens TaxID=1888912 RepID=UPI002301135E|nr:long-chain-fatty-acid--CoA ligase [Primorskyibacter aestuariivivens]MDA7429336.1 long-chain-fatty-acid--CoA ligase [Primorskyibacter aestuariivivens]
MMGQMMQRPLQIIELLRYGAEIFPEAGVVSRRCEGDIHRQSYPETMARVAQLAHGLAERGVQPGDRIATLAWNTHRHFEIYYAVSGMGAVCHTLNPRLSPEQMLYIIGHAEDRLLFVDLTFVPLVHALADKLPEGMRFVVMTDRAHMPDSPLELICYEDLLDGKPDSYDWPDMDENTAAGLCYTSGTTGNPKGALYSHRSTVLHALAVGLALNSSLREGANILPVVPMFHVNAWGLPYAAPLTGASLIMPGPGLDGPSLWDLMDGENVTSAWGVPTVWLGLQNEIAARGGNPAGFEQVVIGGSAAPRTMIEAFEQSGVSVCHAWGMTEMSPVGTHGILNASMQDLPFETRMDLQSKQGRRVFGCEMKIVDEEGQRLPHDGKAVGELYVRGNQVIAGYFHNDEATEAAMDAEGWFGTGDVASIDAAGFLTIQDRAKDLIKSGGEWISSIDLESCALAHPEVANCAVIAIAHPKWDERPLLVVVPKGEAHVTLEDIHALMEPHFAKWQLPDDVVFVDEMPLTATGKVSKRTLRAQFADYVLPDLPEG